MLCNIAIIQCVALCLLLELLTAPLLRSRDTAVCCPQLVPGNKNFPHICWMNWLPFTSSGGASDSFTAYCFLTPHSVSADRNCWFCLLFDISCLNWSNALLAYLGIDKWTHPSFCSPSLCIEALWRFQHLLDVFCVLFLNYYFTPKSSTIVCLGSTTFPYFLCTNWCLIQRCDWELSTVQRWTSNSWYWWSYGTLNF